MSNMVLIRFHLLVNIMLAYISKLIGRLIISCLYLPYLCRPMVILIPWLLVHLRQPIPSLQGETCEIATSFDWFCSYYRLATLVCREFDNSLSSFNFKEDDGAIWPTVFILPVYGLHTLLHGRSGKNWKFKNSNTVLSFF